MKLKRCIVYSVHCNNAPNEESVAEISMTESICNSNMCKTHCKHANNAAGICNTLCSRYSPLEIIHQKKHVREKTPPQKTSSSPLPYSPIITFATEYRCSSQQYYNRQTLQNMNNTSQLHDTALAKSISTCPYPFLKPRLGIRRWIGVCPPSNPGPFPPLRAFDPLCPLPQVFPVPDPFPLPTRFLSLVDPGFGERLFRRSGSWAAATAP